jgi:hypothetical protein
VSATPQGPSTGSSLYRLPVPAGGEPELLAVPPDLSAGSLTIVPPFMTNSTRASAPTSASGSPRTSITSASRPGASSPTRSDQPSSSAAFNVAARRAEDFYRSFYPSAEWLGSQADEINGHPCAVLDLRTDGVGTQVRNIILLTSVDDRPLFICFNVIRELE